MIYKEFKRKFSTSMYKNKKFLLAEMSFFKDFVNTDGGDLYPVLYKDNKCSETVEKNVYSVSNGTVERMFCEFFPYANYEICADISEGKSGFCFEFPEFSVKITADRKGIEYLFGTQREYKNFQSEFVNEVCFSVQCRPGAFDVYLKAGGTYNYFCTFSDDKFQTLNEIGIFSNSYTAVFVSGYTNIKEVKSYIDNGISIADIRPIRYENSEVMIENGKIYLTASVRLHEECFQGVFSWIPGTAEIELTGAVFYDAGDGKWCGDVAASVLYNRDKKRWYLWVCSFSHGHILAHSEFEGDIRFGISAVDVKLMEKANENAEISEFKAFENDEDPDFFYDEENDRWLMCICRINPNYKEWKYSYVFFESKSPFDGYKYIGKGPDGCETGGSFVRINGEIYFICGNAYDKKSDYRIYSKYGMKNEKFNFPDGGFRGWGTVIPVKQGSRTRYYHLTFDRHRGSEWGWSYGNLYCFEL